MLIKSVWIAAILIALPLAAMASGQGKTATKNPIVVMDTSMGIIKIEVFVDKAPITAKNFLDYVKSGFYDGTIFNRIIPNFVVQTGGYTPDLVQKPMRPPIKNEASNGLKNVRGTLSMAHTTPDSATSHFFINLGANTSLDPHQGEVGYAVFGKVIEGMDVVDKIGQVKTATRMVQGTPFEGVPVQPVMLKSAKVQQ